MQEIKFRYIFKGEDSGVIITEIFDIETIEAGEVEDFVSSEESELGEKLILIARNLYTGLKDKNGVEIYKGDIVVCREMHDSNVFCNAWENGATWQSESTKPIPKLIEKDTMEIDWVFPCDIRIHPTWWEVIGNIYKNPELLEKK